MASSLYHLSLLEELQHFNSSSLSTASASHLSNFWNRFINFSYHQDQIRTFAIDLMNSSNYSFFQSSQLLISHFKDTVLSLLLELYRDIPLKQWTEYAKEDGKDIFCFIYATSAHFYLNSSSELEMYWDAIVDGKTIQFVYSFFLPLYQCISNRIRESNLNHCNSLTARSFEGIDNGGNGIESKDIKRRGYFVCVSFVFAVSLVAIVAAYFVKGTKK